VANELVWQGKLAYRLECFQPFQSRSEHRGSGAGCRHEALVQRTYVVVHLAPVYRLSESPSIHYPSVHLASDDRMAGPRPGFTRHDTDNIDMSHIPPSSSKQHVDTPEFHDRKAKDGATVEVTTQLGPDAKHSDHGGDLSPESSSEDFGHGQITKTIETAKDITTNVLHVDDDPTLDPYTFRVFFLGESFLQNRQRKSPSFDQE
jgi:hypothetical protein